MRFFLRCVAGVLLPLMLVGCSPAALLNVTSGGTPDGADNGVRYGDHERQVYDVYRPENTAAQTPVVVFFYGGSWDSGKRGAYAFVGNGLANEGYITAVVDYRVYPEIVFPDFVHDGAAALAHIRAGFPDRPLFVMGHSAGAHIAALLSLDAQYLATHRLQPCQALNGFIGLAGPYDFLPLHKERLRKVFPPDLRDESQPVNHVSASSPPVLLIHGTDDSIVLPRNTRRLAAALKIAGVDVTTRYLDGAGHVRPVIALSKLFKGTSDVRTSITEFTDRVSDGTRSGCG